MLQCLYYLFIIYFKDGKLIISLSKYFEHAHKFSSNFTYGFWTVRDTFCYV